MKRIVISFLLFPLSFVYIRKNQWKTQNMEQAPKNRGLQQRPDNCIGANIWLSNLGLEIRQDSGYSSSIRSKYYTTKQKEAK